MPITGSVGGDVAGGDTVTLTVNGAELHRYGRGGQTFSISVPGSGLAADGDLTVRRASTTASGAASRQRLATPELRR